MVPSFSLRPGIPGAQYYINTEQTELLVWDFQMSLMLLGSHLLLNFDGIRVFVYPSDSFKKLSLHLGFLLQSFYISHMKCCGRISQNGNFCFQGQNRTVGCAKTVV